jgi:CDP-6-deoxy-D-xylo-4-hexulose-3-dehydrase
MNDTKKKIKLESYLNKNGIETRPFIAGNLLRQPFLKRFKKTTFNNSDFIEFNAFYIGNNQFINKTRMNRLFKLLKNFYN